MIDNAVSLNDWLVLNQMAKAALDAKMSKYNRPLQPPTKAPRWEDPAPNQGAKRFAHEREVIPRLSGVKRGNTPMTHYVDEDYYVPHAASQATIDGNTEVLRITNSPSSN
jgi:hypothetical protein